MFDSYDVGKLFSHPDPYHISEIDSDTIAKILNISDTGLEVINKNIDNTVTSRPEFSEYMHIFKESVDL